MLAVNLAEFHTPDQTPAAEAGISIELPLDGVRALTTGLPPNHLSDRVIREVSDLHSRFGINVPRIGLGIARHDDRSVRIRFADGLTPAHAMPPVGPDELLESVIEVFRSEALLHLALWVSDDTDPWDTGLHSLPLTASTVASYLPELRRRLASQQVSVTADQVLVEATLRGLGLGDLAHQDHLNAMEDEARRLLGRVVLAHLDRDAPPEILSVADIETDYASTGELRDALLERYPLMASSVKPVVLQVPQVARRAVTTAMRPLADVVHVVGVDELDHTPALEDRWRAITSTREGPWEIG